MRVVVACTLRRCHIGLVLRLGREAVAADVLPRSRHARIRGRGEPGPDAIQQLVRKFFVYVFGGRRGTSNRPRRCRRGRRTRTRRARPRSAGSSGTTRSRSSRAARTAPRRTTRGRGRRRAAAPRAAGTRSARGTGAACFRRLGALHLDVPLWPARPDDLHVATIPKMLILSACAGVIWQNVILSRRPCSQKRPLRIPGRRRRRATPALASLGRKCPSGPNSTRPIQIRTRSVDCSPAALWSRPDEYRTSTADRTEVPHPTFTSRSMGAVVALTTRAMASTRTRFSGYMR